MKNNAPIGIFDSGIGGLTVAKSIASLLPNEQLIYFGDTAHMPYGEKSKELIRIYATKITQFLIHNHQCKAVVIACNTASAAAYEELRDTFKGSVPIINVIDPMIEAVISDEQVKQVGIIATKTTIHSNIYQEKLNRRKPSLSYAALATPLLASMIEEGFYKNDISKSILEKYLSDDLLEGIDSLILACTHYPLIKDEIDAYFHNAVKIFDSAIVVANKLKHILQKENLLASEPSLSKNKFFVSDYTESFKHATKIFFNEEVNLELAIIEE
jgi:glutamate racemase